MIIKRVTEPTAMPMMTGTERESPSLSLGSPVTGLKLELKKSVELLSREEPSTVGGTVWSKRSEELKEDVEALRGGSDVEALMSDGEAVMLLMLARETSPMTHRGQR